MSERALYFRIKRIGATLFIRLTPEDIEAYSRTIKSVPTPDGDDPYLIQPVNQLGHIDEDELYDIVFDPNEFDEARRELVPREKTPWHNPGGESGDD
jgi:hypothetical protein